MQIVIAAPAIAAPSPDDVTLVLFNQRQTRIYFLSQIDHRRIFTSSRRKVSRENCQLNFPIVISKLVKLVKYVRSCNCSKIKRWISRKKREV